jgi:hypothetical protein
MAGGARMQSSLEQSKLLLSADGMSAPPMQCNIRSTRPVAMTPVRLNLSVMVQCFSLTTNQPTVLFNLVFQPSEQG